MRGSGRFPAGDRRVIVGSRPDLDGAAGRAQARLVEPLGVDRLERLPLGGNLVLGEDRVDRADRLARRTIDALVGLDVEHPATLVDAVDRAFVHARTVFDVDAGFSDHERHGPRVPAAEVAETVEDRRGLRPISVFGRVDERSGSVLFVAVRAVILTVRTLVLSALVALVVSALVALVISALVALVVVALAAAVVALAAAVVALAAAVVALAAAVVALAAAVVALAAAVVALAAAVVAL